MTTRPYVSVEPPPVDVTLPLEERVLLIIVIAAILFMFCLACGYLLRSRRKDRTIIEKTQVLIVCPYCSTKVEHGMSFCPNCGGEL